MRFVSRSNKEVKMDYNINIRENENFPASKNTKNILLSFWFNLEHYQGENLKNFIEKELSLNITDGEKFKFNGNSCVDLGGSCDRRGFDQEIIFPKKFKTKEDALEWIDQMIKYSSEFDFYDLEESSLSFIDADIFMKSNDEYKKIEKTKKEMKKVIEKESKELYKKLEKELNNKFKNKKLSVEVLKSYFKKEVC